jgi:hypothetical protein
VIRSPKVLDIGSYTYSDHGYFIPQTVRRQKQLEGQDTDAIKPLREQALLNPVNAIVEIRLWFD